MVATSESGIVSRQISAIRHSKRNSAMMTTTRMNPSTSAWVRLVIASLTKSACWNTLVSNLIPGSPGWRSLSACSTPAVIRRLLAQGSFSATSSTPGPPSMIALPIRGWCRWPTVATSPSRTVRPFRLVTGVSVRLASSEDARCSVRLRAGADTLQTIRAGNCFAGITGMRLRVDRFSLTGPMGGGSISVSSGQWSVIR